MFFSQLISEPPAFKLGAVRGSNEEDYFKHHVNSSFRKIYNVNLQKNSVTNLDSGIALMKTGYVFRFLLRAHPKMGDAVA